MSEGQTMNEDTTNSALFLDYFKVLEKELKKLNKSASRDRTYAEALEDLQKQYPVRDNYFDLKDMGKLRNAIVHQHGGKLEAIAEPHKTVIEKIRKIINLLENPKSAFDIASKPVTSRRITDSLQHVLEIMKKEKYSCVPIIGTDDKLLGLLSEYSLLKFLSSAQGEDFPLFSLMTIESVQKYIDEPSNKDGSSAFEFVPREMEAYKVAELYDSYLKKENRLTAVFVTQNGKPTEGILGIITPWDLPRISEM